MYENPRIRNARANPVDGTVVLDVKQTVWMLSMWAGTVAAGTLYLSLSGLLLFLVTSAITLCGGHSLGMHRKLIHNSFDCPAWLERIGVYLGTLVGLGGPFKMAHTHDMRDWAQRQTACHDYFAHRGGMRRDACWQLFCRLELQHPPQIAMPKADDSFYQWLDRYHYWQQLPWAVIFFLLGGWGWVLWGVCARVAVSMTGHWLVGYYAHNQGGQHHVVEGAAVQGYDVHWCGLITFGECWHNNHHAFPGSAKLGIFPGQSDPGWWVLCILQRTGLVWNLRDWQSIPQRSELKPVNNATGMQNG